MKIKDEIIIQIQNMLHGPLWLGESFSKKLNKLPETLAFERPLAEMHSVAEQVAHLTVWIEACIDRMNCISNELKENDPNDWKDINLLRQKGWSQIKEEFFKAHARLSSFADTCDDLFLNGKYQIDEFTNKDVLFGLIQHDAYHLGQIGITIKLLKANESKKI